MADYFFGEIVGNPEYTTYADRDAAMKAGVHQLNMQGISGNSAVGANSIVVNGGYEDDEDYGDVIIYTGAGGNDTRTKKQVAHQSFAQFANAGLVVSEEHGLPVRVIRGSRGDPAHSPPSGFRYDGLYRVDSHWYETGKSGFRVCRYRLVRLTNAEAAPYSVGRTAAGTLGPGSASTGGATGARAGAAAGNRSSGPPVGTPNPGHSAGVTVRVIRDTAVSNWIKYLYKHACQVCDYVLDLPVGKYAEGAHIRALGSPHNGPDTVDNMLCLCPTHHLLLDKGAIYISDGLDVHDYHGTFLTALTRRPQHLIDLEHIRYHRAASGF